MVFREGDKVELAAKSGTLLKDREAPRMLAAGTGVGKIARKLGVGSGTIQKIKDEMTAPKAA